MELQLQNADWSVAGKKSHSTTAKSSSPMSFSKNNEASLSYPGAAGGHVHPGKTNQTPVPPPSGVCSNAGLGGGETDAGGVVSVAAADGDLPRREEASANGRGSGSGTGGGEAADVHDSGGVVLPQTVEVNIYEVYTYIYLYYLIQ